MALCYIATSTRVSMAAKAGEKDAGRVSRQKLNVCLEMTLIPTKRSDANKPNFQMIAEQNIPLSQRKAKTLVNSTNVFSMTQN